MTTLSIFSYESISAWVKSIPPDDLVKHAQEIEEQILCSPFQHVDSQLPIRNAQLLATLWFIEERHVAIAKHHASAESRLNLLQSATQNILESRAICSLTLMDSATRLRTLRSAFASAIPFRWWLDIPLIEWNRILPADEPSRFALLPLSEIDGHWDDEPRCPTFVDNARMVKKFCPFTYTPLSVLLDAPEWQGSRVNALAQDLFKQQRNHLNGLVLPPLENPVEINHEQRNPSH